MIILCVLFRKYSFVPKRPLVYLFIYLFTTCIKIRKKNDTLELCYSRRLEDRMFRSKKCYFEILHVQMLPSFLFLLRRFILMAQPHERAKVWSLGLVSGVLLSSLFIRHPMDVNEHSFYSVPITHDVQWISPPCAVYLLFIYLFFNISVHHPWCPVASRCLQFQSKRRNYSAMKNIFRVLFILKK